MDVFQVWRDAANEPVARAVVTVFLFACLILLAVYFVGLFRNLAMGKGDEFVNPLEEIERLKGEGKIDFVEYQRLKQAVAKNMANSLASGGKAKLTIAESKLRAAAEAKALAQNKNQMNTNSGEAVDFTEDGKR